MPSSTRPETADGRPRPNFFIAGAPRCGTTALHSYLNAHPSIFMSRPKEPLFWADDFPQANLSSYARLKTVDDYLGLFTRARPDQTIIGEATATYLYSKRAVSRIEAFVPDARYIVLLRNPVELVYSWHAELLYNYYEDVADFRAAWNLQTARARGESLPAGCFVPEFLQYEKMGRLGDQVDRLLATVPRERVKVLLFDDFARDTPGCYRSILRFLGVEDDGRTQFERINASKQVRFPVLGHTLFHPPEAVAPIIRGVRRVYANTSPAFKSTISKLLRKPIERDVMPNDVREMLTEAFQSDMQRLEQILGRDLSPWRRGYALIGVPVPAE